MRKQEIPKFDAAKFLSFESIKLNLLLASLYLSAYEMLKFSIIDSVAFSFVDTKVSTEETDEMDKETLDLLTKFRASQKKRFEQQVREYKDIVGVAYDSREQFGFIPSCEYLKECGALTESDLDTIRQIRAHRHTVAHELPHFLTGQNYEIKVELFGEIRRILHKSGVYWARVYDDVPDHIADEDVFPGPVIVFDQLWRAVQDYVEQKVNSETQAPEE